MNATKLTSCGNPVNELREIDELKSILREMTSVYKELVADAGGCDHSVGFCWCSDYWLIERAKKVLNNV